MANDIVIIHSKSPTIDITPWSDHWVKWQTCMRSMVFTDKIPKEIDEKLDIYSGPEAFEFCLKIVCGLDSPVFAETEVYGQFKAQFLDFKYCDGPWGQNFKSFIESIILSTKKIRSDFLIGLGSQSYGSEIRKLAAGFDNIGLVGAGQLGESILPWLVGKKASIQIFNRNLERAEKLIQSLKLETKKQTIYISSINQIASKPVDCLIIAAPINDELLAKQISNASLKLIIDLRAESSEVLTEFCTKYMSLKNFFSQFKFNQKKAELTREKASNAIVNHAKKWHSQVQIRPFGWEDLCG